MPTQFRFTASLWEHEGEAAWFFASLPESVSDDIADQQGPHRRGFGSVRVSVTVGSTTWKTSVFPDSKRKTYILPVKKAVRTAERLTTDTPVAFALALIDE